MTAILGLSAFFHDSAACLVADGEIVAAAQEERFTREKYDAALPAHAIDFCLREGGIDVSRLDYVAFYDKPLLKFERLLETYLAYAPAGFESFTRSMPVWLKKKLFLPRIIREALGPGVRAPLVFVDHHESHAASAFFASPFDSAAILTLDGVGEWSTATLGVGRGHRLELQHELRFPHSLGLLYSAFTYYCGFAVNSGEYKLMGLAPYGRPVFADRILERLVDLKPDGSLWLDMDYFNYCQGLTMTGARFDDLFGGPPRRPDAPIEQRHMDLAASIQSVTEECVLRMGRHLHTATGIENVALAGGVALNCVANGRLQREGPFRRLWIQPAAGDAGGALGAALFVWHHLLERPRTLDGCDRQKASYLGPAYTTDAIERELNDLGAAYERYDDESALLDAVVGALASGRVVGWFQGRAEFGPRALGARSILADARSASMQATLNLKIKFRESFRPFAPAVLRDRAHEWFAVEAGEDSPYMLTVAPVRHDRRTTLSAAETECLEHDRDLTRRVGVVRSAIPAVTHVDYSARIQTVDARHGRYCRLLERFAEQTGCPVLINTSFNLSWEPIVETPAQAYHTFMQSEMDVLVLENCVLEKPRQPLGLNVRSGVATGAPAPWADPVTGDPLTIEDSAVRNPRSGAVYPIEEGIARLFVSSDPGVAGARDVTSEVRAFYEDTPFPNYEDIDTPRALLEKARAGLFARMLNDQIPYGARVLEVGCGTGQLTNFLAIAHRTVVGVDASVNSLRLANAFRERHGLERAAFAHMNLLRPALPSQFFDVVISNGVLHHTADCRGAFRTVGRLVRPGGFFVVGLYNAYSRSIHYARRALFRLTGVANAWLDPHLGRTSAAGKRRAWLKDQYEHPHESAHTLDEVLAWLDEDGFDFASSIPKADGGTLSAVDRLFLVHSRGSKLSRVSAQLASLADGYQEGGFFIVIGRRRA